MKKSRRNLMLKTNTILSYSNFFTSKRTVFKVHLHWAKTNCFLWSLSLPNINIQLDSLWAVETFPFTFKQVCDMSDWCQLYLPFFSKCLLFLITEVLETICSITKEVLMRIDDLLTLVLFRFIVASIQRNGSYTTNEKISNEQVASSPTGHLV